MAESYTSLKGFDSINTTDIQSAVQQNLLSFFDWGFIDKGAFSDVRLNTIDIRAKNKSTLKLVNDPNFADGRVWSTFRQNLVWESGVSFQSQPIQISGIYVNGSFKTTSTSGYAHYVDYPNGRVVFSAAIPKTSTVSMEYSYKNILFTTDEVVPIIKSIEQNSYNISSTVSGLLPYSKVQLPLVCIEMSPDTRFNPFEIGNSNHKVSMQVLFHTLAEDDETARKISTFIGYQSDKTIYMYNPDAVASGNAFPFDYLGRKSESMWTYPNLTRDYPYGYRYNKLYMYDTSIQGPNNLGTVYHSVTKMRVDVLEGANFLGKTLSIDPM